MKKVVERVINMKMRDCTGEFNARKKQNRLQNEAK